MTWLVITLVSSACLGLIHVIDKIVLHKYIKTPLTLILLIGVIEIIVGSVMLCFSNIPNEATFFTNTSAIASGAFIAFAQILLQRILYTHEVSRTVPIAQSSPIFAALLALFILGESISIVQWIGIIIVVLGSILISLKLDNKSNTVFLSKSFYSLIFSAMLFGASSVTGKIAVEELSILYTQGLRNVTFGLILVSFALKPEAITDVKDLFHKRSPGLILVMINGFVIAQVGSIMLLWALSLGPASLVTSVAAVRVLFTFIYSIGLTKMWTELLGEDTSNGSTLIKLLSTVLIVAGIVAISI
jgi:transporter family protein